MLQFLDVATVCPYDFFTPARQEVLGRFVRDNDIKIEAVLELLQFYPAKTAQALLLGALLDADIRA